jgi:hypothetical protein
VPPLPPPSPHLQDAIAWHRSGATSGAFDRTWALTQAILGELDLVASVLQETVPQTKSLDDDRLKALNRAGPLRELYGEMNRRAPRRCPGCGTPAIISANEWARLADKRCLLCRANDTR